jgi:hypothetical protein
MQIRAKKQTTINIVVARNHYGGDHLLPASGPEPENPPNYVLTGEKR